MLPDALMRTFVALGEAIVPEGGPFAEGAATVDAGAALRSVWLDLQLPARRALAALLVSLDAASVLRTGRRLHRLPAERRVRLCDALEQRAPEPWRSAYVGVKTLLLVLIASDRRLQAAMGSEGWPPQLIRE